MTVNANKPELWKSDIAQSVDFYNQWFLQFAPKTYRENRIQTTAQVEDALTKTSDLTDVSPQVLREHPSVLPILRMATAPPIARDRLIGLAGVSSNLVKNMEADKRMPPRMEPKQVGHELERIGQVISRLVDPDIFPWVNSGVSATPDERYRAATVVADRLCGAISDPIIRNAQEQRQLFALQQWLEIRGYVLIPAGGGLIFDEMIPGTFAFRLNIPIRQEKRNRDVNIPIDTVIMPKDSQAGDFPLLVEAKSAGDFTNTNKRRKEEATKVTQLRHTYGQQVRFILFLCGYFDSGYLGYEAAEGIDWVWEHRIDDLAELGV
ncbi:MAG: XamI family restriction endonuclease [Caldilineaceae bacterium]|nr:XamI family restriction endonuclease [Caldilineaceae bacterium]MBP8108719.1 XamI family restriction endonuclease [Caldilineaceae bacterium]MBP8125317.1 XamI family restriction endonuclease [Caldilineaceae bacterium]MBP9073902.1 XamI family restriction endonuclease [Caldilineaceae bacterium]